MAPTSTSSGDPNAAVRRMFDAISGRYDLLNRVLSATFDRSWRRRAAALLPPCGKVLDLCAGTADLAIAIDRAQGGEARIVAADFSGPMLDLAGPKLRRAGVRAGITRADARMLPLRAESFDGVAVAFGIRNITPPEAGLREMARVLRPGGHLLVLEFFGPAGGSLRTIFAFYFRQVLPRLGGAISGASEAYRYLPDSVARFVTRDSFGELLRSCGLDELAREELSGGIATAWLARRRPEPRAAEARLGAEAGCR